MTVKAHVHGIHDTSARVTGIAVFKSSMHLSSQNKSRERYMISVNLWPVGKLLYIEIPGECYLLTMRLTNKHWEFVEGSWGGGGGHRDDKKGICFLKGTESWWVMDTPGHAWEVRQGWGSREEALNVLGEG